MPVSPPARFVASDRNATLVPSAEMDGSVLAPPVACASADVTLARVVVPDVRSRTKTSVALLLSAFTIFVASDWKAT